MKRRSLKINSLLNVIKSGLAVLFPLVTYPYAVRVLGAENIGKVSYSQSIVSYFALIATLGLTSYSVREGAKIKNDPEKFQKFANEIFSINIFSTVVAYFLLLLALAWVDELESYRLLILILSLSIALTTFGVDWINTIFEDYYYITFRSIVAYIISFICLFLFVHEPTDYYIYALLTITSTAISCFGNWFYCRRYVIVRFTIRLNLCTHLKPMLILFANLIAISIYVNIDTTMLGWIKGDYDVGLYAIAVKVYNVIKTMLAAVYTVSIPRLSFYAGNSLDRDYKSLFSKLSSYLSIIVIPSCVGLICVSDEIMTFMGGTEYLKASPALQVLAVAIIFAIYGGLMTTCLNVTLKREIINLQATSISATLNGILNLIFIPWLSYIGAAITTAISEAFVLLYCLVRLKNKSDYMNLQIIFQSIFHAVIASVIMFCIGMFIKNLMPLSIFRLIVIVFVSVFIYIFILVLLRDKILQDFIDLLRKRRFKG